MRLKSNLHAAGAVLAAGLLLAAVPAQAATYSRVIAFGDSLSDTGNFLALTGNTLPQPGDYFEGRFSNGTVAVEWLADGLGVALQNYAYGGAKTGTGGQIVGTGLQSQVLQFASSLGDAPADPNALYFVWGGANDLRDITPATFASTISGTITNLTGIVGSLYQLGARHFLLPNLPDLGITPLALLLSSAFWVVLRIRPRG